MKTIAYAVLGITLIALAACATSENLPVERPEIRVAQINTSEFVQERGGTFSVRYRIEIENPAEVPITAEWIEVQTADAGPYVIRQTTTNLRQEVPAGERGTIDLALWAYSYGGPTAALEPVTLRIRMRFESERGSFQVRKIVRLVQ